METEGRIETEEGWDRWPVARALGAMLGRQRIALDAVERALPALERAVELSAERLAGGSGRLVLVGAGASGRIAVQDGVELRGPSGGICPTCEHGFDPGVATCPTHGEELVPWALWQEEAGEEDGMRKICPVCGSQYAGSSGFCGADGTALETVN